MAITVATQKIWHKAYEHALATITSLRNHCDFKYEKDSKNADTVYILNAVRPIIDTTTNSPVNTSTAEIKKGKLYANFNSNPITIALTILGNKLAIGLFFINNIGIIAITVAKVPNITSIEAIGDDKLAIKHPIIKLIE